MVICDACKEEPKTFVNYCCKQGSFSNEDTHKDGWCKGEYQPNDEGRDWKPEALKKAEEAGTGIAIYDSQPKCTESHFEDSREHTSMEVIGNGTLTWGKISNALILFGSTVLQFPLFHLFAEGTTVPRDHYCLSHVGQSENGFWQTYLVCKNYTINSIQTQKFLEMFDLGITPALFIVSMTFLVLTFGLLYREKRHKLFG